MAPRSLPGTCLLCREPVTKRGVLRHVESCLRSPGWPTGEKPSLLIRVQGRRDPSAWQVVLARADATLEELDGLIREAWSACCEHRGTFTIDGGEETGMTIPLESLLPPGMAFSYECNAGQATRLDLKVIGTAPVLPPESRICPVVRSASPVAACVRGPRSPEEAKAWKAMDAICDDLDPEIRRTLEQERRERGDYAASIAKDIIIPFSVYMCGPHGRAVGDWDGTLAKICLLQDMAANPLPATGWVENAVPVLCRFVTCLQESGRLRDARGIIAALTGAEAAFRKAATNPEKFRKLSRRLFAQALDAGVNPDDRNGLMAYLMQEVILMLGLDPDNEVVRRELAGLVQGRVRLPTAEEMRADRILLICEEFCSRCGIPALAEDCSRLIDALAAHPAAPLTRGDAVLWSAAIVYAASQDAGLTREAKAMVGDFFGLETASIRSKVRTLRKYLPKEPGARG